MERYVIHVTKQCNMACVYCYEKDKTSTYTWGEIASFCRNIINSNRGNNDYSIEFLGGEPCLAFEHIKQAVDLFITEDPHHAKYFIITTNGTLINSTIINFLKNNPMVMISVSIDGDRDANSLRIFPNRKYSYNIVTNNIRKLMLFDVPTDQISVHMVTHPFNVMRIYDSIYDFYNMGIRNISIGTVERAMEIGPTYREIFLEQMQRVSDSILDKTFDGLFIDILETFNTEKPKGRIYIYDQHGKMIGESYAEASDDITNTDIYQSTPVTSQTGDFIFNLRKDACLYYRNKKKEIENA